MKAEEFFTEFEHDIQTHKKAFIKNMSKYDVLDNTYCKWAEMFILWMEWVDEEDCKRYHGED